MKENEKKKKDLIKICQENFKIQYAVKIIKGILDDGF